MRSRKWFGLLLAVLLVLGSLVAGSVLADGDDEEDDELTLVEAETKASLICHDDAACISSCIKSLLSGYGCRL